jgi:hypothetical protein
MHDERRLFTSNSQPAPHRRASGSVTNRSRVSNGEWVLEGVDNRLPQARRFRDLCRAFANLAGGELSEPDKLQVRQAALLALRSEVLQTAQVAGEPVDNDEVIRIGSELRRALAPIVARGEARRPEAGCTPELRDYLEQAVAR